METDVTSSHADALVRQRLLEAQKSQLKGQIEQQQVDLSRNTDALLMKWKEIGIRWLALPPILFS